jgi:2-oxoglutarate ferredoxin oxidoreductase subunit beta
MKTKSTPMGSIDHPVNPIQFAIGAEASFIARTVDTDPKHMVETFKAAHAHKGISFVEILQNCVIYNKDVWEDVYGRESRAEQILYLADGQPLIYGKDKDKGIRLNNLTPEIVTLGESGVSEDDLLMHNPQEANTLYTTLLSQLVHPQFPTPIGVFRALERPVYEDSLQEQIDAAQEAKGQGDLQATLFGGGSWVVE